MRVLVTGAAGMLGHALVPLLGAEHEVTAVDVDVDVTRRSAVDACFRDAAPQAVFHLAAWTDVDGAEAREDDATAVNGEGSRNVARASARHGASLVCVSTDYVFDGAASAAYTEDDPARPVNAYGRSKLAGERAAVEEHPSGVRVARTAWLYGAGGRNFVDTIRRLGAERDEVHVVDDQEGSPTWTRDLAPALVALLDLPAGTYHTTGAGSVTWAGLARAIFEEIGSTCRVTPATTADLGRPARRPARSVLASTRRGAPRLRHWRDALNDYLREDVQE